uniref:Uncharacterized protein n=1 Tax=Rhizophora mucronata TaxID=61149 RepID=A0A2P2QZ26_RHIMU
MRVRLQTKTEIYMGGSSGRVIIQLPSIISTANLHWQGAVISLLHICKGSPTLHLGTKPHELP